MVHRTLSFLTLLAALSGLWACNNTAQADDIQIQSVKDLAGLGNEARARNLPIMLVFTADHCVYCIRLERDYLKPMLRSGDYTDKIIMRMIKVDDFATLTDFNGRRIEAENLPSRYGGYVTPTMVFLNSEGKEIAPKLIGIGTEGFFAGDIDDSIELALEQIKSVAMK